MKRLPVLTSLQGYDVAWLTGDVLAGTTLVAIAIPEQMATAQLGNMPAVTGLYAFLGGAVMFALLGSSRQLSIGADSTIAPVFAAGVATVAATGGGNYVGEVTLLALIVGVLIVLVGLFRLGWIADFLSTPVITGFLAGIAVTIVVGQLPEVFGIAKGDGATPSKFWHVVTNLGSVNGYDLAIALAVLAVVFGAERINAKLPGAMIALIASTLAVSAFNLRAHGVEVLGSLPAGLPPLSFPPSSVDTIVHLMPVALTVALICLTQTAATTRSFADLGNYEVDINRDFIALGAGSLAAGVLGAFPVNASPPRTAVVASSGGRSQVSSLVATAVVLLLVLFATGLLSDLPKATLGAVLIFVALRIFRVRDLRAIFAFDKVEFAIAVAALLAVTVVGVEQGVIAAIVLSIGDRVRRSARPRILEMGRSPGTTTWIPISPGMDTETVPGVRVELLDAALWFANAPGFKDHVRAVINDHRRAVTVYVLDAAAVEEIDFTGARTLRSVVDECHRRGVVVAVARAVGHAAAALETGGITALLEQQRVFPTVEQAVRALAPQAPAPAERGPVR